MLDSDLTMLSFLVWESLLEEEDDDDDFETLLDFSPELRLLVGSWPVIVERKREYLILAACPFVMGCSRTGSLATTVQSIWGEMS